MWEWPTACKQRVTFTRTFSYGTETVDSGNIDKDCNGDGP